jgi:hypothetical protein
MTVTSETAARGEALTGEEQASPLAKRIYDLRRACLSLWLNAASDRVQPHRGVLRTEPLAHTSPQVRGSLPGHL